VRHYELFDYMKARWRALSDIYIFQKNKMTHKHLKANLAAEFALIKFLFHIRGIIS